MQNNESEMNLAGYRGNARRGAPRPLKRTLQVFLLVPLLSGCAVGLNYTAPQVKVPDKFAAASTQPSTQPAAELGRWWESFNDPQLDSLIARAVQSNLDLRVARLRVRESRSQLQIQRSGLFPVANGTASYQHERFSKNGFAIPGATTGGGSSALSGNDAPTRQAQGGLSKAAKAAPSGSNSSGLASAFNHTEIDTWQGGFDASWELDIFGGVRRSIEAARADEQASVEARRDALVTLLAEVARNYIDLRGGQRELAIAMDNVKSQQDTLELTRSRFAAGLTSDLDVARAEALVATTQSQIPAFEISVQQSIHRLGVLLGQEPNALQVELSARQPIPPPPPEVPVGLPSELVRRRPDVRQAERQLAAANARIGAATADLFPRVALTGDLGVAAGHPQDIFNSSSVFYSLGPQISWRIFDANRIFANIHVQNAREEEAVALYQSAVLKSLEDVENALVSYSQERMRWRSLKQASESNRRAVDLATQLYNKGLTDFLNVLEAQRNLFASEDQLAQSERNVSGDVVALYKALGGGWEAQESQEADDSKKAQAGRKE